MNVKTLKQNQAGFSLVELMVVVAIIGILAAIAIPNFERFQARAKQKEAGILLSGFYTANKAIYAEYNYYPGNFPEAGFNPEGRLEYQLDAVITPTAAHPNLAAERSPGCVSTGACAVIGTSNYTQSWTVGANAVASAAVGGCGGAAATATTFTAAAASNLNGAVNDQWEINNTKQLTNCQIGLP